MHADPIADMLTRIRNATMIGAAQVSIPRSKVKLEIARILKQEGYIEDYRVEEAFPPQIIVNLRYYGPRRSRKPVITSIERVSKPGRRIYVAKDNIPWVLSGMGLAILSTSKGMLTDQEARRQGVGGEVICYVK
jgi:small subunit ribosomal protein S8